MDRPGDGGGGGRGAREVGGVGAVERRLMGAARAAVIVERVKGWLRRVGVGGVVGLVGAAVMVVGSVWPVGEGKRIDERWAAAVVRRGGEGGTIELAERSIGGLHASEVIGQAEMRVVVGRRVVGGWIWPRVEDEVEVRLGGESEGERAVKVTQAELAGAAARACESRFQSARAAAMFRDGLTKVERVEEGAVVRLVLVAVGLVMMVGGGVVWSVPRVRAWRRGRVIARGECPGCGLGLANMRDRECPKCHTQVTAAEFNALRAVWREKGVGRG